jgi:ribosomal protein S18 acetylase RimI-like enzyme
MVNHVIRQLQLFDAINLFNLFNRISEEDKEFFNPHPFDYTTAVSVCTEASLKLDLYFVVTDPSGVIVGYSFLRGWKDGYKIPRLGIYLAPEARGKGIAKELLKYMIENCPSLNIQLKVKDTNYKAIKLYMSFGFYEISRKNEFILMEYTKFEK